MPRHGFQLRVQIDMPGLVEGNDVIACCSSIDAFSMQTRVDFLSIACLDGTGQAHTLEAIQIALIQQLLTVQDFA